jgi:hypothetical protein
MQRVLFSVTLLALSSMAVSDQPHGGTWKDAQVADITVYTTGGNEGKGYVVVTFAANGTGTPSCASGYPRSVAIGTSTGGGGGGFAAAIMQSALLSGMPVTVTGTGSCSVSPTIETVASVQETGRTGPMTMSSGPVPPSQPGH